MYILDHKIRKRWFNYLWQSVIAGSIMILILVVFSTFVDLIIVAAMGATTFTVFAMPRNITAKPRNVIGGHLFAIIIGSLCTLLVPHIHVYFISGIAIAIVMFLMVITNTEHPPAAGTALGIVISAFSIQYIVFVLGGAIILSIFKYVLNPWMIDLTDRTE